VEEIIQIAAVEPPRGIYSGSVDEKGRLKLPVSFQLFLTNLGETKVFATSFDMRIARLYPISEWKKVDAKLKDSKEDAQAAEDLWFMAMDLGGDAEMDSQGRLMLPPELRRTLEIEKAPVHLQHYKGHIKVYSDKVYNEIRGRAQQNLPEKLSLFETKGLQ
jgi:MraZ protein